MVYSLAECERPIQYHHTLALLRRDAVMQITDAGCPDRHEQFWLLWVLQYQGA